MGAPPGTKMLTYLVVCADGPISDPELAAAAAVVSEWFTSQYGPEAGPLIVEWLRPPPEFVARYGTAEAVEVACFVNESFDVAGFDPISGRNTGKLKSDVRKTFAARLVKVLVEAPDALVEV